MTLSISYDNVCIFLVGVFMGAIGFFIVAMCIQPQKPPRYEAVAQELD